MLMSQEFSPSPAGLGSVVTMGDFVRDVLLDQVRGQGKGRGGAGSMCVHAVSRTALLGRAALGQRRRRRALLRRGGPPPPPPPPIRASSGRPSPSHCSQAAQPACRVVTLPPPAPAFRPCQPPPCC